jgi:hypothetical protein
MASGGSERNEGFDCAGSERIEKPPEEESGKKKGTELMKSGELREGMCERQEGGRGGKPHCARERETKWGWGEPFSPVVRERLWGTVIWAMGQVGWGAEKKRVWVGAALSSGRERRERGREREMKEWNGERETILTFGSIRFFVTEIVWSSVCLNDSESLINQLFIFSTILLSSSVEN